MSDTNTNMKKEFAGYMNRAATVINDMREKNKKLAVEKEGLEYGFKKTNEKMKDYKEKYNQAREQAEFYKNQYDGKIKDDETLLGYGENIDKMLNDCANYSYVMTDEEKQQVYSEWDKILEENDK